MRNWMLSLAMAAFGLICISHGVATRDNPEARESFSWGMMLVGALFAMLGAPSFIFANRQRPIEFDYEQSRGPMRLLARFCMLFGAIGLLSVVFVPSVVPWEGYAPWIVWVFTAWFMWTIMVGAGLEYAT